MPEEFAEKISSLHLQLGRFAHETNEIWDNFDFCVMLLPNDGFDNNLELK